VVKVTLNNSEEVKVFSPYKGQGGFQSLFDLLCESYNPKSKTLKLNDGLIEKVKRYNTKYGTGGFQDRLQIIVDKL